MVDRSTNEFLASQRAQENENDLFAAIGKQVLGLQLGDDEDETPEDERVKIVEEIESLCMNCHEDVGCPTMATCGLIPGHAAGAPKANTGCLRVSQGCFLLKSLTFAKSFSCLSTATIAISKTPKFSLQVKFKSEGTNTLSDVPSRMTLSDSW